MSLSAHECYQVACFWLELETHFADMHVVDVSAHPSVEQTTRRHFNNEHRPSAFRNHGENELRSTSNGKTYGSVYGHRAIDAKMRKAWEPLPKEKRIFKERSPVPHVSHDYHCGISQQFTDDLVFAIQQELGTDVDLSCLNVYDYGDDI